jgi:hypothetical protein
VRNTLQAIAPAILGFLLSWALLAWADPHVTHHPLWRGPLIYFIGIPALAAMIAGLTYWNFKRVLVGWPVWRRNLLILSSSLTLVVTATTAIYHRAWEYFAAEPAHGPSRLTLSQVVALQSGGRNNITVQFADGRVWLTPFTTSASGWTARLFGNWRIVEMLGEGHFMAGTNWMTLAHCRQDVIGLQKDGSLWVSEQPENLGKAWRRGQPRKPEAIKLVRFGNDSDWKCLAARWTDAYLVKNDGSLWRVGMNRSDGKKKWPGLRAFPPRRMGADADWAAIEIADYRMFFRKRDGRVYVTGSSVYSPSATRPEGWLDLGEGSLVEPARTLEEHRWRCLAMASSPRNGTVTVRVAEDGRFYLTDGHHIVGRGNYWHAEPVRENIQLSQETNWVAVAGNGRTVVTLRADGSLWKWNFPDDLFPFGDSITPKLPSAMRLGTHSDWQAIVGAADGLVSLAADGSLWFWHLESHSYYDEFQPLLAQTRKPQRITNIFGNAD